MNAHKIVPNSKEGLGITYYSQADNFANTNNKFNWKCGVCGKVYLNRWKAKECCSEKEKA